MPGIRLPGPGPPRLLNARAHIVGRREQGENVDVKPGEIPFYRAARKGWRRLWGRLSRGDRAFCVRDSDVFLVSYPRSGSTWIRYLLAHLIAPDGCWNVTNLDQIVPDVHQGLPRSRIPFRGRLVQSNPRILKSHWPYQASYPRVVYLYRDGRDVAVSYHDFCAKLRGYRHDLSTFVVEMLEGKLRYGAWQDHVSSWLFRETRATVLPMSYEHLYADTTSEIERLGAFLGFRWAASTVEMAIARSSLERQRNDYYRYKRETHWERGFRGGVRGAPGAWRQAFDRDLNDLFWRYAGDVARRLGYPEA
jgi:hypothetical protein